MSKPLFWLTLPRTMQKAMLPVELQDQAGGRGSQTNPKAQP
jgi:hypothetical protein